jgi:hypothetical protein
VSSTPIVANRPLTLIDLCVHDRCCHQSICYDPSSLEGGDSAWTVYITRTRVFEQFIVQTPLFEGKDRVANEDSLDANVHSVKRRPQGFSPRDCSGTGTP